MMIKILFFVVFAVAVTADCGCGGKPKPKCGKQGANCGRGAECCKAFYCNISPDDRYAYCDSRANPTCGKQGDICGPYEEINIPCCENYICNTSNPDSYPFCDLLMTIG